MKRINYANPQENLKWFKKFTQICKKHKIWYSVLGGTMIGAIREKGPIVWDDDYDVLMTLNSYEKLKKLFPDNCLDGVVNRKYPLIYPKFVPNFNDLLKSAIYVDIFLIYPTTEKQINKLSSSLNKLRAGMTYIHSLIKFKSFFLNTLKIFTWILKPFIKKVNYKTTCNILVKKKDFEFYYIPTTPWSVKREYIMSKTMSFKTKKISFSDFTVEIINEYDEHLTKCFGDYMVPVNDGIQHINTFEMGK